jgi:hypothetical protein
MLNITALNTNKPINKILDNSVIDRCDFKKYKSFVLPKGQRVNAVASRTIEWFISTALNDEDN